MIVVCNNCDAKYDVKDEVIPEQGAQLKCAKCGKMIFVTKNKEQNNTKVSENKNTEYDVPEPFSDFDERPTILADESFHEAFNLNKDEEPIDEDSSSKSGISPNFLSDKHKDGPSFEDVFDDFEEEISNESEKEKEEQPKKEEAKKEEVKTKKKSGFDDALDDFFDDLVKDDNKSVKKEEKKEKKTTTPSSDIKPDNEVEIEEIEVETDDEPTLDISELNRKQKEEEERKKAFNKKEEFSRTQETSNIKVGINDSETQEISNFKMNELKEKLKDGLSDSDFIDNRENIENVKINENKNTKIYVKVENGPSIEFQMEKDLIDWLKAKSSLKGVMYSLDDIEFSPILNHQLFKDVEEILSKAKEVKEEVISASQILDKREIEKKSNLMPFVIILLIISLGELAYILMLLGKNTDKTQNTVKNEVVKKVENETTKVKIKKKNKEVAPAVKENVQEKEQKEENAGNKEEKKEESVKDTENKEIKKQEVKKEETQKEEKKEETVKKEKKEEKVSENKREIEKILPKDKRNYYRQARLAFKAKKIEEATKRYLTLAYNYPKEAEAYGVLYGIFKKDKNTKKYAVKFLKAYKALSSKKENTFVDKKLIEELFNKK